MSDILSQLRVLAERGEIRVSDHAYDELIADDLIFDDVLNSLATAEVVDDYPDYHKGPSVLPLHSLADGRLAHAVWGIRRGATTPAVPVTAYLPAPDRWTSDLKRRLK